jgi:mannose-6-phosphate isomerase-like protein (cupin superfamily)
MSVYAATNAARTAFTTATAAPATPLPSVVHNPITGDTMEVLRSALENGGGTAHFRFTIAPGSEGTPPHLHPELDETFTVVAGRLGMLVGAARRVVLPGETVVVPTGTVHRFWNASGDEPAVYETTVTPGADFERFIRGMYGLAQDGATDAKGAPKSLLHFALLLQRANLFFPGVPVPLQHALFRALTRLARRRGADRDLDRYAA